MPQNLRQVHRIQNPISRHATLARHLDTPVHVVEFGDGMCVRIDAHDAAELERRLVPTPVEVEPPGMRVDLDGHAVLGAGAQHLLDVDVVARSPEQLSACHVADDRGVRIRDCPQEAVGLSLPVQLEAAVDARHDEVETLQNLVAIIERAVGQDVGLDALQDPEFLAEALVEAVGLAVLLLDLLQGQPAGVVRRLRMVGYPKYWKNRLRVAFAIVSRVSVPSDASV
jgi:hypothetical protein